MAKLSLIANPYFNAKVKIPVPGQDDAEVTFTFKHRTKDELEAFGKDGGDDVQMILDMAIGWDLPEALNEETVRSLTQNYYGAPEAIATSYFTELMKARKKN